MYFDFMHQFRPSSQVRFTRMIPSYWSSRNEQHVALQCPIPWLTTRRRFWKDFTEDYRRERRRKGPLLRYTMISRTQGGDERNPEGRTPLSGDTLPPRILILEVFDEFRFGATERTLKRALVEPSIRALRWIPNFHANCALNLTGDDIL